MFGNAEKKVKFLSIILAFFYNIASKSGLTLKNWKEVTHETGLRNYRIIKKTKY